ncbi:MAG: hypothetical protein LBU34_14750, partial [Planctomycetaceae bacterium]|nr:hypothetical protein [Planctomycetaceae bacterium]
MKKTTERKTRFKKLSRKPLAAITLLTALVLPIKITQAQTVNGNDANLQTAIQNVSANNGIVTIGNISMRYNHDGILIGGASSNGAKTNLTIKGTTASNLNTNISQFVTQILSNGETIQGTDVNNIFTSATFNTNTLSYITGNNQPRNTDKAGYANAYKWFTTTSNAPSGSNGLGFENILFKDVTINYDFDPGTSVERKFVNGLIGNRYNAGSSGDSLQEISTGVYGTSLGKLTGNEFS